MEEDVPLIPTGKVFEQDEAHHQALYRQKLQNALMYGQQASATLMGRS